MTSYKAFFSAALAVVLICLMPTTVVHAQTTKLTWAGCIISKNAFMAEMVEAYKRKTGIEVELKGGGATKGIRQVASGEVDIGGTCRHVLDDPKTMNTVAEERRTQLTPVAWDALVAIVHKTNSVNGITIDQLRGIFLGKITNWKELGGADAPIEVYARTGKISGIGRPFREIVFANYDQEFAAKYFLDESETFEKHITKNPNGIGISAISNTRKFMDLVKILQLDGREPTYENIKSGQYVLYRPLYMVTHLKNPKPEVRKFLQFVLGPEGQQIMRSVGTVPYEDGISLWLKYLDQQGKAIARMHGEEKTAKR